MQESSVRAVAADHDKRVATDAERRRSARGSVRTFFLSMGPVHGVPKLAGETNRVTLLRISSSPIGLECFGERDKLTAGATVISGSCPSADDGWRGGVAASSKKAKEKQGRVRSFHVLLFLHILALSCLIQYKLSVSGMKCKTQKIKLFDT